MRARATFAFLQDLATQAAALGRRIDRHEADLRFRRRVEVETADREGTRIHSDNHEMLALASRSSFSDPRGCCHGARKTRQRKSK